MCNDPKCQFCIPCQCGHRADEHVAGIGDCFLCKCEIWRDKETGKTFAEQELAKVNEKEN